MTVPNIPTFAVQVNPSASLSPYSAQRLDSAAKRSACSAGASIWTWVVACCAPLADGGVRSGLDVVRMLALGARAVLPGRACACALAAEGEAGVRNMLGIVTAEMRVAMTLTAGTSIGRLGADCLSQERI